MKKIWIFFVILSTLCVLFVGASFPEVATDVFPDKFELKSAFRNNDSVMPKGKGRSDVICLAEVKEEGDLLYDFNGYGYYFRKFDEELCDREKCMKDLGFESKEELLSLFENTPSHPLAKSLTTEELASLFFLMISFTEEDSPIECHLNNIAFDNREDFFVIYSEIDLLLGGFQEAYFPGLLPERATVIVQIPFIVENSELSADYEKIVLRCNGQDLPETLVSLCYGIVLGAKVPEKHFADAVGNVIRNACFSG